MGIFAHHEGLVCHCRSILFQIFRIKVTVIPNGRIATVAVVERRTGGIKFLNLIIHSLDVGTNGTFIAETPENDARMVEVALHQ